MGKCTCCKRRESACHPPPSLLAVRLSRIKHVLLPQHRLLPLLPLLHPGDELLLCARFEPPTDAKEALWGETGGRRQGQGLPSGWPCLGLKASALNGPRQGLPKIPKTGVPAPHETVFPHFFFPAIPFWAARGGGEVGRPWMLGWCGGLQKSRLIAAPPPAAIPALPPAPPPPTLAATARCSVLQT